MFWICHDPEPQTSQTAENTVRAVRLAAQVLRRPGYNWMLLENAGHCREVPEEPRTMPARQALLRASIIPGSCVPIELAWNKMLYSERSHGAERASKTQEEEEKNCQNS